MLTRIKEEKLQKRHLRVRKKVSGLPERPRLTVKRSHLNLIIQVVDDVAEKTLFSSSTVKLGNEKRQWGNIEGSKKFGVYVAGELKKKKINQIVFDRGGRQYHGRIKAFADTLRENGIKF